MARSHADQHDLDKLGRWLDDLTGITTSQFPVYAVFLVSAADRFAHDIFRRFRSSFEAGGAGFANLVIFGQHGESSTVRHLLARWQQPEESIPGLVLLPGNGASTGYFLALPKGSEAATAVDSVDSPWQLILNTIEAAATGGATPDLAACPAAARIQNGGETLERLVRDSLGILQVNF